MKLLTLVLPFLAALPLVISARPASPPQQQALGLSPANTFSSDSDSSTKSSKLSSLKSAFSRPKSPSSGPFKCHRYPPTSISTLSDISDYITTLLRSYRETIFGGENHERMLFETCYAGYDAGDVSPSIFFGKLQKKQAGAVEKLLRNQVVGRFPDVSLVTTKDAIAVVVKEKGILRRRNTV